MSKKKAFSGSTMTLKDFHGGSIPSDLPLPSAPGVIVRPSDRPGYDRQSSWGSAGGRSDHRLRPNSSGSMRSFDDKTPFLSNNVNIGRYFDEDERKPLDGLSGTRRAVSDDSFCGMMPNVLEVRQDAGRFSGQQSSGWGAQPRVGVSGGAWSGKIAEGGYAGSGTRVVGGNVSQGSAGSYPNAWGVRKEVVGGGVTAAQPFSAQNTVAKFAQASALDKVSSGRWLTKPMHYPADVEVITQPDLQNNSSLRENAAYEDRGRGNERVDYEKDLVMRAERELTVEDGIPRGSKDMPGTEKLSVEAAERPKLKLLPRTRPVTEPSFLDNEQGNVESHGSTIHAKSGLSEEETEHQFVERPRLNLKPRSQPIESEATADRRTLFGGARPRELVLKDRGVDDTATNEVLVQTPTRVKSDVPSVRTEAASVQANPSSYSEKIEGIQYDHRVVKGGEKKDQRINGERVADAERKNPRNENWRSGRDGEKHQHQHQQRQQERRPSPETWRRPVEEPKPAPDASGMRFGKAVSAVELATAFSRSVLEPKPSEQFPGRRGLPGSVQIPFSRLTGPAVPTRSHINGY